MPQAKLRIVLVSLAVLCSIAFGYVTHSDAQQSISVRVERFLTIKQITGNVQYLTATASRPAAIGNTLRVVNDGVRTGVNASSTLEVDTGIGTITLREQTELRVQKLDFAPDNGRITHLYVPEGQVNLNLRRFTHQGSELEIETPAGVSGVRGTEFGVLVQPDGSTGVATRSGAVVVQAQRQTVDLPSGYQTLVRFGLPPLPPVPIPAQPTLNYRVERLVRQGQRIFLLIGSSDPGNQIYVNDELQTLTAWGEFGYRVPATWGGNITVKIITPLGDETEYVVTLT